jgi:TPR repeat protein
MASNIDPATSNAVPEAAHRKQAERLLSRGELYMIQGNVVVARQYYQRAAEMGVANAAIKLAETHDPHELPRLNLVGLAANPAEAKRWYQRASALGAAVADARLRRLEVR